MSKEKGHDDIIAPGRRNQLSKATTNRPTALISAAGTNTMLHQPLRL